MGPALIENLAQRAFPFDARGFGLELRPDDERAGARREHSQVSSGSGTQEGTQAERYGEFDLILVELSLSQWGVLGGDRAEQRQERRIVSRHAVFRGRGVARL